MKNYKILWIVIKKEDFAVETNKNRLIISMVKLVEKPFKMLITLVKSKP